MSSTITFQHNHDVLFKVFPKADLNVSHSLRFRFPKTYPCIAPDISLLNPRGLSNTQCTDLQKNLSGLTKEILDRYRQEMVFAIPQFVQEYITAK